MLQLINSVFRFSANACSLFCRGKVKNNKCYFFRRILFFFQPRVRDPHSAAPACSPQHRVFTVAVTVCNRGVFLSTTQCSHDKKQQQLGVFLQFQQDCFQQRFFCILLPQLFFHWVQRCCFFLFVLYCYRYIGLLF